MASIIKAWLLALIWLGLIFHESQAFLASASTANKPISAAAANSATQKTRLFGNTKQAPAVPVPTTKQSYGEDSRKFRRTVFTHDDWRKFRDPDRFTYYLTSMFNSGVYKSLSREVGTTTAIATFIVVYNCVVGGYTDVSGLPHAALVSTPLLPVFGLPLAPFTLSSPALGLLLGKCWTVEMKTALFFLPH
jgi:ion channel-forming bestrophin family protein